MDPSELMLRFALGGFVVLVVSLLAETDYWLYSGLAVLFPAVTLVGFYFAYYSATPAQFREILVYSALSVPVVFFFVVGVYVGHTWVKGDVAYSLGLGLGCWFLAALVINIIYKTFWL